MGIVGSAFRVQSSEFRVSSCVAEENRLVVPQGDTGYLRLLNEFEIIFSVDDRKAGSGVPGVINLLRLSICFWGIYAIIFIKNRL